jgi:hypothetical protein
MTTRREFLKEVGGGLVVVLVASRAPALASLGAEPALLADDAEDTNHIAA